MKANELPGQPTFRDNSYAPLVIRISDRRHTGTIGQQMGKIRKSANLLKLPLTNVILQNQTVIAAEFLRFRSRVTLVTRRESVVT